MDDDVFSPEEFVENLLNKGAQVTCDESNEHFTRHENLPEFYNEDKFKQGQKFYHRYIFAMFLGKLMGLISILAIPSILKILKFTNMSSEPLTAYKRYLATIFHMNVWYHDDFKPGSDLWKSIEEVRGKHNFASKRSCINGFNRITQTDMALTQFGFMGFAISRSEMIGIHDGKREDFEAYVHLWKVIGRIMGIEDRFNICRDSLEETQKICALLIEKVFKPRVSLLETDFVEMSTALLNGMWCMMPMLNPRSYLVYLLKLHSADNQQNEYEKLSFTDRISFKLIGTVMYLYKFTVTRLYHNRQMYVSLWLMKKFPFLAYYKFGKAESHVVILNAANRDAKSG